MPLEFSSSSDEGALDATFQRENRRRQRSMRSAAPARRPRQPDDDDSDEGPPSPPVTTGRLGIMVDRWIDRRAGTVYHVAKGSYIPLLDAKHNTAQYFGEPNRRMHRRSHVDPSSVRLRCVDDGSTFHLNELGRVGDEEGGEWLRLPIVSLAEACVRGFYLAFDNEHEGDLVPDGSSSLNLLLLGFGKRLREALDRCIPYTTNNLCWAARSGVHAPLLRECPAPLAAQPATRVAGCAGTMLEDDDVDGRIVTLGTVSSAPGHHLLAVVRCTSVTFLALRRHQATEGMVSASVTSSFLRLCQAAYVSRDMVLLAQLQPPRYLNVVFQTESHAVGTRLGGARHAPATPLPTTMAVAGSMDQPPHDAISSEVLILQGGRELSIISIAHMFGRLVGLPRALGPSTTIGQTARGVLGTDSAVLVGGTSRGVVYALADDPRCKPAAPMVLTYGAHREAIHGDSASSSGGLHGGGVQNVLMQGPYGFLSVDRCGGCRLWDIRMCCSLSRQCDPASCVGKSSKSITSFNQPSRPSVDSGCSIACFGRWVAVCSRLGHVDVFCSRTGCNTCTVEHAALSRAASMTLMPVSAEDEADEGGSLHLLWTSKNRTSVFSTPIGQDF